MAFSSFLLAALFLVSTTFSLSIESSSLRTEGLEHPNGLSTVTPTLSWRLIGSSRGESQAAFQIQAASSVEALESPDLWDTGKVLEANISVQYAGTAVASRSIFWWRVRVWSSNNDTISAWSPVTTFEIGLLEPTDWSAQWITNTAYDLGATSLPLFLKTFEANCPVTQARAYALGLGVQSLHVNGNELTDQVLAPGYSDYNKTLTYTTYNISTYLTTGTNSLGLELGRGLWDTEEPLGSRYQKITTTGQPLKLIAQLEYTCDDGALHTVASDDSWKTSVDGPQRESSWYGGEEYDATREISGWSDPDAEVTARFSRRLKSGTFGTGLFDEMDWSSAQWIGAANSLVDELILRTNFTITKEISKAEFFIAGLGNYEAYISGGRVGDHYLAPGFTTYSRRYLYDTHDITSQLTAGDNAVGIAVGQAWFPLYYYGPDDDHGAWDGNMRARAQLLISFSDGTQQTIVTDDSWKGKAGGSTSGAATPDNELLDEREEPPISEWARASFDSSTWPDAIVQAPPATIAQSTPMEPVRIMETISAVSITNPSSGVRVYDFGRNIAGFAAATLDEAAGTQVDLHYTEKLSSSGRVVNEGSRYQFSTYITAGNGSRTFLPRSSYYGFRYIEVTGVAGTPNAQTVVAHHLHSDVQGIGWFSTSETLLQWIHDTTWQTILNNIEGVPTDGAYVEKLPWTADADVMSETAFSSFSLKDL